MLRPVKKMNDDDNLVQVFLLIFSNTSLSLPLPGSLPISQHQATASNHKQFIDHSINRILNEKKRIELKCVPNLKMHNERRNDGPPP